ncbi:EAL domain-containing protein [Simiduia sp. 21SJ11W-1]|uniref:two-component system response regulator n=1 Tax=Simiduia sp. 21SJ11W-1 TaxID=2909669 RepID=UPI0020A05FA8|nr:EAL domain-containing protein [Simiduia sp. 21SJ11W-1]UTA48087.1 EAL domain-containing protein [Simiduia sp. 21SJ11W-1]
MNNQPTANHPNQKAPLKLLLVDDDRLIRLHIKLGLNPEHFSITEAECGAQAITLAATRQFDIILMDVNMPDMDGFTTCQKIKQLTPVVTTPVLMLTALDDTHSINRATEVGALDYITKPLSVAALDKRLQHIVEAQRNARALDRERENQIALLKALPDIILRFNSEGTLIERNLPNETAPLLKSRAIIGVSLRELFNGITNEDPVLALSQCLQGNPKTLAVKCAGADERHFEARFFATPSNSAICILRDITDSVNQQRYIQKLSLIDEETGLPNKTWLLQVAQQFINQNPFSKVTAVQIRFTTLIEIKNSFGDQFFIKSLKKCAQQLGVSLNTTLGIDVLSQASLPFLARTGDSEFHVLCAGSHSESTIDDLVADIIARFRHSFAIESFEVSLPVTLGIASQECSKNSAVELLRKSGLATLHAHRSSGAGAGAGAVVYTEALQNQIHRAKVIERDLRQALATGELQVAYQPKVCNQQGLIRSVEALARWTHPTLGFISPGEFIPIAEDCGLIIELGEYVLAEACQQIKQWQSTPLEGITIAVNISGHQLNQIEAETRILKIIQAAGIAPSAIELEITETVVAENAHVVPLIQKLRARGIKIALDDFGTGYSSLSMLDKFPIDTLKIDRSFVMNIGNGEGNHSITDAIIALGHALKLNLVAEGVETLAQLQHMQAKGCHLIQGYFTGKPMRADEVLQHATRLAPAQMECAG